MIDSSELIHILLYGFNREINQLRTNLKDMKQRELEAGPAGTNSQFLAQTASSEQFRTASTHLSEPRQAPTLPDIRATLDAALVAQAPASSTDSGQVLGKQASGLKS